MKKTMRKLALVSAALALAGSLTLGAAAHCQASGWCSLDHDHAVHARCTLIHDHAADAACALDHDHALDHLSYGWHGQSHAGHHAGERHGRHH